jgi:hypothetical protein
MAEVNLCDTVEQLREWKTAKYDGVSKMLAAQELREVIALYNRRIKAVRDAAAGQKPAAGASDFPGDR